MKSTAPDRVYKINLESADPKRIEQGEIDMNEENKKYLQFYISKEDEQEAGA